MSIIEHHRRSMRYDAWANRESLAALRSAGPLPRSLRWLAHIIGAERLWICRLKSESHVMAVWPELTLDQCEAWLTEIPDLWREFMDGLDVARLAAVVTYTNSKGEPWTNSVGDILTHVVIHSAHHRGQIAHDVRAAGRTPAYTDFIHAVRTGSVTT